MRLYNFTATLSKANAHTAGAYNKSAYQPAVSLWPNLSQNNNSKQVKNRSNTAIKKCRAKAKTPLKRTFTDQQKKFLKAYAKQEHRKRKLQKKAASKSKNNKSEPKRSRSDNKINTTKKHKPKENKPIRNSARASKQSGRSRRIKRSDQTRARHGKTVERKSKKGRGQTAGTQKQYRSLKHSARINGIDDNRRNDLKPRQGSDNKITTQQSKTRIPRTHTTKSIGSTNKRRQVKTDNRTRSSQLEKYAHKNMSSKSDSKNCSSLKSDLAIARSSKRNLRKEIDHPRSDSHISVTKSKSLRGDVDNKGGQNTKSITKSQNTINTNGERLEKITQSYGNFSVKMNDSKQRNASSTMKEGRALYQMGDDNQRSEKEQTKQLNSLSKLGQTNSTLSRNSVTLEQTPSAVKRNLNKRHNSNEPGGPQRDITGKAWRGRMSDELNDEVLPNQSQMLAKNITSYPQGSNSHCPIVTMVADKKVQQTLAKPASHFVPGYGQVTKFCLFKNPRQHIHKVLHQISPNHSQHRVPMKPMRFFNSGDCFLDHHSNGGISHDHCAMSRNDSAPIGLREHHNRYTPTNAVTNYAFAYPDESTHLGRFGNSNYFHQDDDAYRIGCEIIADLCNEHVNAALLWLSSNNSDLRHVINKT